VYLQKAANFRAAFVNMEEIPLGVAYSALIQAFGNPALERRRR
jgi:hypothetical protein